MVKLWGLACIIAGDMLLVGYFTDRKQKPVQCLWEMIGFLRSVTCGVTEWKRTLKKAVLEENQPGVFPKLFQKNFVKYQKELPLRDALNKSLESLPLPPEAMEVISHYFDCMGKTTNKDTEEQFRFTRLRLEELLKSMQKELPKAKKLITSGVYSISAMVAILLL